MGVVFGLQDKREPEVEPPWLFKVDPGTIAHISVTHLGETVEYENTENGWVIKDGADTPVYMEKWSGTTLLLSGPRSSPDVVGRSVEDLSVYGLEDPQTRVTVTDYAGTRISFNLGDPTPDGQKWYAALAGDARLYTVVAIWCEVVSKLASEPPYPPEEPEDGEAAETEDSSESS